MTLVLSVYSIMSSTNSDNFTSSLTVCMTSCLSSMARTYNIMLNTHGKSRHPCLVSDFRREIFSFSPLSFFQHLKNFVPLQPSLFWKRNLLSFKFAFLFVQYLVCLCFKILSLFVFRSLIMLYVDMDIFVVIFNIFGLAQFFESELCILTSL